MSAADFRQEVEAIVKSIPKGRVMTYGQIAAIAGSPGAARIVGGIAHYGDSDIAWHRIVNKRGALASGYPGGRLAHKVALKKDGVIVSTKLSVKIKDIIWWPKLN